MDTYIAYFDESGDDGLIDASSETFTLTSLYMNASSWQQNYNMVYAYRKLLKEKFGFHISMEMHTKNFLTNKNPYRKFNWSAEDKQYIIKLFAACLTKLKAKVINVVIDKNNVKEKSTYNVLENALKYNIQRIENDSNGNWNFLIITDSGRIAPMRRTARAIRAFNPIQSKFDYGYTNAPITGLIEDILEKDSEESYFIQLCDYISYFVHLYYKTQYLKEPLPGRVADLIDEEFVCNVMDALSDCGMFNEKASPNKYGLVIYPKK